MCTAATYKTKDFYFGRTLDYEFSYGDQICITPRNYSFNFRHTDKLNSHYALIGMAHIVDNFPLYYDAMNEKGLAIAGLNFVGNAKYSKVKKNKLNIAQFELIPYLLSRCENVKEVKNVLKEINITDTPYSKNLPVASLHWIIADKDECIVLECMKDGMHIYSNPIGVLTNNPSFDIQMFNLNNYMGISASNKENTFGNIPLVPYSRGMGGIGLPGDLSSMSRFVKVAFTKLNSISKDDEESSVSQFFHILGSVDQQRGCCKLEDDKYEITIYTSCMNVDKGFYYYTTYENSSITRVNMFNENLDGSDLISFEVLSKSRILFQN